MALIAVFLFLGGVCCIHPSILSYLRSVIVSIIANFIADILEHDRVQAAAASAMVKGMNATSEQPDLADRMSTIYVKLQSQEHVSRQLGEQFPKVAGAFLAGAAAGLRKKDPKPPVQEIKNVEPEKKEPEKKEPVKKEPQASTQFSQWGLLFRGGNSEKKKGNYENADNGSNGHSAIGSSPSFQSYGSDHLVETDKDSMTNDSGVDSLGTTDRDTAKC
eukprot:scaffold333_cov133-Cylindrotheca_fusiformis.AAC.26